MRSRIPRLLLPLARAVFRPGVLLSKTITMSTPILGLRARSITTYTEGSDLPRQAPRIWPAPTNKIEAARDFIRECAASPRNVLIVPDRDADGLSSGTIVSLTLQLLDKPESELRTHFISPGMNIFNPLERARLSRVCRNENISHMIVLDQGSRAAWPLVEPDTGTKTLVIDHHYSQGSPENTTIVNAGKYPPIATSSLLTYIICSELHPDAKDKTGWLALLGIFGDLGPQAPLDAPYPEELKAAKKKFTTKHIEGLVTLLNAPRRTPECGTRDAWELLQHTLQTDPAPTPKMIMLGEVDAELVERLTDAKKRVHAETKRCTKFPPRFSKDKKVAVVYMDSMYQVHPLVATIWARYLNHDGLKFVLAANGGYMDGKVNFSCRPIKLRKSRAGGLDRDENEEVNIISMLKEYAAKDPWLEQRVGEEFANGHTGATGGILSRDVWKVFVEKGLELIDRKPGSKENKTESTQKNTLDSWLGK